MDRIEYTSFVTTSNLGTTASVEAVLDPLHRLLHLPISNILSLLPTPEPDHPFKSESPTWAIAGALVGVILVVVAAIAVVLLVVLVMRRRQRKSSHAPDTQEKTVDNAIYAGNNL